MSRPFGTLKADIVNPWQRQEASKALRSARRAIAGRHLVASWSRRRLALTQAGETIQAHVLNTNWTAEEKEAYTPTALWFVGDRLLEIA